MTDSPPRIGPLFAAGLLFFSALCFLWGQCRFHDTPAEGDWKAASAAVVEIAEPTDGIRVHPTWSEAPLPHLQEVGNLVHRPSNPILEDFLDIERVLILAPTDDTDEALELLPFDTTGAETRDFDTVTLVEVEIPESHRLEDDARHFLDQATVAYRSPDGDEQPCRQRGDEWRCDGRDDNAMVRPVLRDMDQDPRRCIQAHPPSGNRHLAIEFTVDEPHDILRVRAGLDRRAARLQRGDDVIYRVYADDQRVAETRRDAYTSTWTPYDIPATDSGGPPVEVRLEVESVAPDPHHRRFCFNVWPLTKAQAK